MYFKKINWIDSFINLFNSSNYFIYCLGQYSLKYRQFKIILVDLLCHFGQKYWGGGGEKMMVWSSICSNYSVFYEVCVRKPTRNVQAIIKPPVFYQCFQIRISIIEILKIHNSVNFLLIVEKQCNVASGSGPRYGFGPDLYFDI